ncbi:PEP-CTERM sorting domain-containing protein [Derxia lacustris]|uniref:PEP-CTERM sorting domain-containing protein n=1 Tax=Derxia lacustris TaxID=764842 RepID=UPI000A16DB0E|nr:PEP-CTERM sorting domain-containing protein [Derxia lacustris]
MHLRHVVAALALAAGTAGSAQAQTYDYYFQAPVLSSFNSFVIGSFTLGSGTWDVTGEIQPLVSSVSGGAHPTTYYYLTIGNLSGGLDTTVADLDASANGFSYSGLGAGTYNVIASGTLGSAGGVPTLPYGTVTAQFSAVATPEPAPIALAGLGVAALFLRRRASREKR